jgi:hypothetical protein
MQDPFESYSRKEEEGDQAGDAITISQSDPDALEGKRMTNDLSEYLVARRRPRCGCMRRGRGQS